MHAGLHFVQRLRGATQHEIVSMDDAPYAQAHVKEAAGAGAALGEAQRNELLGQKRLPASRRVAGAVEASYELGAIALRRQFRGQLRVHHPVSEGMQVRFARIQDTSILVSRAPEAASDSSSRNASSGGVAAKKSSVL